MNMIAKAPGHFETVIHYIVAEPFGKSITSLFAIADDLVNVSKVVIKRNHSRQPILPHCPHSIIHRSTDTDITIRSKVVSHIFRKADVV